MKPSGHHPQGGTEAATSTPASNALIGAGPHRSREIVAGVPLGPSDVCLVDGGLLADDGLLADGGLLADCGLLADDAFIVHYLYYACEHVWVASW